jgi:hypothetical protein
MSKGESLQISKYSGKLANKLNNMSLRRHLEGSEVSSVANFAN